MCGSASTRNDDLKTTRLRLRCVFDHEMGRLPVGSRTHDDSHLCLGYPKEFAIHRQFPNCFLRNKALLSPFGLTTSGSILASAPNYSKMPRRSKTKTLSVLCKRPSCREFRNAFDRDTAIQRRQSPCQTSAKCVRRGTATCLPRPWFRYASPVD